MIEVGGGTLQADEPAFTEHVGIPNGPKVRLENGWHGRKVDMHPLASTYVGKDVWMVTLFVGSEETLFVKKGGWRDDDGDSSILDSLPRHKNSGTGRRS